MRHIKTAQALFDENYPKGEKGGRERARAAGKHGGTAPIPHYYIIIRGLCGKKVRAAGTCWIESRFGKHGMREHLLSDRLAVSFACRIDRFCCPIIRV